MVRATSIGQTLRVQIRDRLRGARGRVSPYRSFEVVAALAVVATTGCGGNTQAPGPSKPVDRLPVSGPACDVVETVVSSEHADVRLGNPPMTVWTGNEYKVFWRDFRMSSPTGSWDPGTYVATVDRNGRSQPERHVNYEWLASTLWTGDGFAVTLRATFLSASNQDVTGVYFWRLDAAEAPVGAPVLLKEDPAWSFNDGSVLLPTEQGFAAAWGGDVAGFAWLDVNGQKLSESAFDADSVRGAPKLAQTTSGFVLSWLAGSGERYFRELDSNGTPRGQVVQIAGSDGWFAGRPHLTWLGDGYVILWTELSNSDSRLSVVQADRSGAITRTHPKYSAGPARFLSTGAETVALVRDDLGQAVLARVDGSGSVTRAQRVPAELDWQGLGELTSGPGTYAVSYIPSSEDQVVFLQIDCP